MGRRRLLTLTLVLFVVAATPVWALGAPASHRPAGRGSSAVNGDRRQALPRFGTWGHGSWSWFGDPRAVYVAGQYDQIFAGSLNWSGGVTVGAYDPQFGVRRETVIGHLFHDDHSAPSVFVEPDGRLTVFWSAHNGSRMYFRSTLRPEDISAWGPLQHVPSNVSGSLGYTYPDPVLLPAEDHKLYLFWRGGDWSEVYATRTLDGRWSRAHELIRAPVREGGLDRQRRDRVRVH
jgi:putative BNR repeat neuraminidase